MAERLVRRRKLIGWRAPVRDTVGRQFGRIFKALALAILAACAADAAPISTATGDTLAPTLRAPVLQPLPPSAGGTLAGVFDGHYDVATHALTIAPHVPSNDPGTAALDDWSQSASGAITIATVGATYVDTTPTTFAQGTPPACSVSSINNCGSSYNAACSEAVCATVSLQAAAGSDLRTVDVQVVGLTTGATVEADDTTTTALTMSEILSPVSSGFGLWRWAGTTALVPGGSAVTGATTWQFDLDTKATTIDFGILAWSIPVVTQVAGGGLYSCALTSTGAIVCWGSGNSGTVGFTSGSYSRPTATMAGGGYTGSNAASIAAGGGSACLVTTGGAVACWGWGADGVLGNGSTTATYVPVAVSAGGSYTGSNAASVALGAYHACLVTTSGAIDCWGQNDWGQLGNGATTNTTTPVAVSTVAGTYDGTNAQSLALGNLHSCARMKSGALACWGLNYHGQVGAGSSTTNYTAPTPVAQTGGYSGNALQVAAGSDFACAVMATGAAACWGWGLGGALGNGSTSDVTSPAAMSTGNGGYSGVNATGIFADSLYDASCVLLSTGSIACSGDDSTGMFGNGTAANTTVLSAMSASYGGYTGTNAIGIGSPADSMCILLSTGTVACAGDNSFGDLGNATFTFTSSSVMVGVFGLGG
ncbi:MAG: RCC1 domain-containing protein [Polyangiales bacterium]